VPAQDPADGPRRHPELGAEPVLTAALLLAQRQHLLLDLHPGPTRAGTRARGPLLVQAGLALGVMTGHPVRHRLAGDAHLLGDMRLRTALLADSLDDRDTGVKGQPGVSVGHRDLRLW
jgi:hypothetical protein